MLTDTECRKAKPASTPYKLTDGGGLHLYVTPAGGKHWRYRYEIEGKERTLSIGPYPAVSLTDARTAREEAKSTKRSGRDPGLAKRLERANVAKNDSETFKAIAELWHAKNKSRWAAVHAADVLNSLQRDVFPEIGSLPVREITIPVVLALLNKIEARGAIETAHRVRQRMSSVFLFAVASGAADTDPAHVVKGALLPVDKTRRQPAITDLGDARTMLAKAEAEPAHAVTKLALRLLALVPVRPGVIAGTPWTEFDDIKNNIWCVPAARMKLKLDKKKDATFDHFVALPDQALDVIAVLRTITGDGPLAFPNTRHVHKPMSENAMGYLLNRAGFHHKHVPHGWRSTFSTVMNERYKPDHDVIELMLAHVPENKTAAAYNRAEHLQRRKELAQIWADLILEDAKPAVSLLEGPRR
jgi:integrase